MKPCFILTVFLCILGILNCSAQSPAEKLTNWSLKNPIEKIYIHTDRDDYLSGQSIWFKGYLYSEFQSNDNSTTVFAELVHPSTTVISRKILPVVRGVTQGQFELPDSLSSGTYFIRAYTATMLNHDVDYVYKRTVYITGKKPFASAPVTTAKKTRMEFFPEGGNFVAGFANTIAFKASDENGWPVAVKGVLKNAKDEIITEFTSYHDGMGMIDLDAKPDQGYYVQLDNDPGQKYPLPDLASKGIVFRILNGDDGIHFEVFQQKNDPVFNAAYMIGQMQHRVVFQQPFKPGSGSLTGVIKTSNLSSGILHITVFNKDGMPLAERLSFVDNKEYIQKGELVTDTIRLGARQRNRITLALKDTVVGSFSVAITDPSFNASDLRRDHIISRFLLTSDLKGYIHNPVYYFSKTGDSVKYALDLVMMTNGWRRFKWEQLLKDSMPAIKYKDPGFITLAGSVNLEGTRKPFADKQMMVFIVAADSSRSMQLVTTDADGNYKLDSLLFFGKASVLFSDIQGKKSKFVNIRPGADSLNRSYFLPGFAKKDWNPYDASPIREVIARKLAEEYDAFVKANGIVLSEVIIKSRKKSALEQLEEQYTSGAFSGDSRSTFDLKNSDEALSYTNIFDYLTGRVPGLVAGRGEDGDYYVYFRQMATISSMGNQSMDIFLDEIPTDATTIAFINPSQIALVKVYSHFVGSTGGGGGGALAIYLKKGADYFNSLPVAGEMITSTGYSVIKEFYSPDYSVATNKNDGVDNRMTLHWKPDIFVAAVNPKIPITFYNNDRTTSFKIVIEGMTVDGKLLLIEKTVTAKGF